VIAAYATYRSLLPLVEAWPSFPQWQQAYDAARDQGGTPAWPFWQLWRLAVVEPRRERELAASFSDPATQHECALASGGTSCAVRSMYERHPYPVWSRDPPAIRWPTQPLDWLQAVGFKPPASWPAVTGTQQRPLRVLWVGCGTGYMLTIFARHFGPMVEVWAVDLSLASLGYAARRIEELGLTNVHFVRGDITTISSISAITANAPYDFMESSGVLHHLDKPAEALTKLVTMLRPGAPVNLALYSTLARREAVTPCRAAAKHYNVSSDLSVRQFRRDLQAMYFEGSRQSSSSEQQGQGEMGQQQQGAWASEIVRTEDYASLTGIRDLCLHPQEKTFTLLKLGKLLQEAKLRWLQFVPTFDRQVQERFEQRFGVGPFSKEATLKKWHEFEKENPSTFAAMYQFFVQRSCAHGACDGAKEEL
jgi:SAM-dependent methyltransferase